MSTTLWEATSYNNYQASLTTGISSTASIIYLPIGASGLVAPGIITLDQFSSTGALTTTLREYISFATITTDQGQISGLGRGIGNSTAVSHSQGALVEGLITVTHWEDMIDFVQSEHTSTGLHVINTATVNYVQTVYLAVTSTASLSRAHITTPIIGDALTSLVTISGFIGASGASVVGFPAPEPGGLVSMGIRGAVVSGTNLTPYLIIENTSVLKSISALLKSPVSASSLVLDINKNNTSIFTDQNTRPSILAGGTYVSTASIGTTALSPGNLISLDVDNSAGGGANLIVLLET